MIDKLERLLISEDVTVNVKKTTQKKQKRSQRPVNKETLNYINCMLRRVTYEKFDVEQVSGFVIYNPSDKAKVAACEEGLGDPVDEWDLSPGYTSSRWNDIMIRKVVDAALEADGEDEEIANAGVDGDFLEALMTEKVERYCGVWQGFQPRFDERLGRVETLQEARTRRAWNSEKHLLASRSASAKHHKYENRVQTITATIEIKTHEGGVDINTWKRLEEMVACLGEQGMC
ncbi:hypothetical protein DFH07DRAFT_769595 [Mycena maculata]|uniref:Uncharacterized protein n=1 Tax=Mycena maculata TaxID=230809 RepID=A0AAD7NMQ9_9AGAR|nr:hypothetical protein DFH07DRAFT_769595 [Mycena maculata]